MSLTITDETITSDETRHTATAWPVPDEPTLWTVTWLPGRNLTRNQAITAMTLAEYVAEGVGDHTDKRWPFVDDLARELGLSGPDAVGKISYHAVDLPD